MNGSQIRYRSGYKYQLIEEYRIAVAVRPEGPFQTTYIDLDADGNMRVKMGYAWDGPSGPSFDTKNFMRGSLVHDALYQLMRDHGLASERWRATADLELKRICLEDGMSRLRARLVHWVVNKFGEPSASPESRKPVSVAP